MCIRDRVEGVPDIWVLTLETGEMKKLTDGRGPAGSPVYSRDGKYIAYYGNLRKDVAAAKSEILVIPAQGGEPRVLTENFDRSMGCSVSTDSKMDAGESGPYWSSDGRFIYFLATDRGYSKTVSYTHLDVYKRQLQSHVYVSYSGVGCI